MKPLLFLCINIACTLLSTAQQISGNWNAEPTTINWQGKAAVGGYAPEGTLQMDNGSLIISENTLQSLELTIDMTSLSQENQQLSKHLKEEDFFHTSVYPTATFILSEVTALDDSRVELTGTMTIKGIERDETIAAAVETNDDQIIITFRHRMDRTHYNVVYNSPSVFKRIKENAIADEFEIWGSISFEKQRQ